MYGGKNKRQAEWSESIAVGSKGFSEEILHKLGRQATGRRVGAELIEKCAQTYDCVLTSQSLAEFYFAATRKGKVSTTQAKQQVADWQLLFPTILPSIRTVNYAMNAVEEHSLSFWDAMLWSVANENAVSRLYSEDFQSGRVLKGVEFLNPFL